MGVKFGTQKKQEEEMKLINVRWSDKGRGGVSDKEN